ncbi:MAG: gamma-glutamyltransferase, partial [SAR324 cluster bacterium]|nr:gamma-glutamyltransferase [SAR324 cluster bacterium]
MATSSYLYGPHEEEIQGIWPYRPTVRGTRHAAVAGHYLAAQAGFAILEGGGNAVDAGVGAGIVETVVESDQVNFAGVAPIMIYLADRGEVVTISGVGTWPKAASCEFFQQEHGGAIPEGLLRTVVPAAPAAWVKALREFGTMTFGEVARTAIRLARDGFPIHAYTAAEIRRHEAFYRRWPANAAIYLPGGAPPEPGDLFVQADLGRTLQYLADAEAAARGGRQDGLQAVHDAFYCGEIAEKIVAYHRDHGGLLTGEDLAEFQVAIEPPERVRFGDKEICSCGFWSQGPVLLQALNLVGGFDLSALEHNSVAYIHTLAEALKLALADRHFYYGDPRMVEVPGERLLSEEYARQRRAMIREAQAWPEMPPPGELGRQLPAAIPAPGEGSGVGELDTSFVCTADRHGNVFAVSPSDPSYDMEVVPGTGLAPSSRGTQSWTDPGHPSSVAPGKRPRLTPNPAMALRDGKPWMAFGTPGGDIQPQAMLQVLLNVAIFGMEPQAAVEAPRFVTRSHPDSFSPHRAFPGQLNLEGRIAREVGEALAAKG